LPHPTLGTFLRRGLRLRCPRCGGGRLFAGLFRMNSACPDCNLRYEREPGYFLGSAYVNYGATALILTVSYMLLRFVWGYEHRTLTPPLVAFCVLFPLFFFRYARALWLAMDCYFDPDSSERDSAGE
jgi:uncharacterized protein (DUF983 family)